jgi:hypothetical protein
MRKAVGALAVMLASAGACKKPPPPAERVVPSATQKARSDEAVAAAKKSARAQDDDRRAVAAKEPPPLVPIAALGACPVAAKTLVPEDPETADTNNGKRALAARRSTRVVLLTDVWENGKPESTDGPATRATASLAEEEQRLLDQGYYTAASQIDVAIGKLEAAMKTVDERYDLTVIISKLVKPVHGGGPTFESGFIAGTVYLWSRAKRSIVCAAEIAGLNSAKVKVYGNDDAIWLRQNLIEAAVLDALPRLVVAGPAVGKN